MVRLSADSSSRAGSVVCVHFPSVCFVSVLHCKQLAARQLDRMLDVQKLLHNVTDQGERAEIGDSRDPTNILKQPQTLSKPLEVGKHWVDEMYQYAAPSVLLSTTTL